MEDLATTALLPIRSSTPLDLQFPVDDLIFLEPLCCVCVRSFKGGDSVVAITGCENTLDHFLVRKSSVPFPHEFPAVNVSELAWRRCQDIDEALGFYTPNMDNPESSVATMHSECYDCLPWLANKPEKFKMFRWMILCRTPFTCAPSQTVSPVPPNPVPLMTRLDNGEYSMITGDYASQVRDEIYILRRALDMQLFLRGMGEVCAPSTKTLLSLVERWSRGNGTAKMVSPSKLRRRSTLIWRITMDEYGISEIERLAARPQPFREWKDPAEAYTIVDENIAKDIQVVIKFGLARLELPMNCSGLQIWDTPSPPQPEVIVHLPQGSRSHHPLPPVLLEDWRMDGGGELNLSDLSSNLWIYRRLFMKDLYASRILLNSFRHFYTIDLTSGLTLLYDDQKRIVDMYPGFLTLTNDLGYPPRRTYNISYIHLPLAPQDEIEEISAKGILIPALPNPDTYQTIDFTIVTKLAGEVHIGPDNLDNQKRPYPAPLPLSSMRSYKPLHMVYGKRGKDDRIDVVGAIPAPNAQTGIRQFNGFRQSPAPVNELLPSFYSEAPLRHVERVDLFGDQEHVIGLILYYQNGAKRAMGEYRPGMTATRIVDNPIRVYIDMDMKNDSFKNIDFLDDKDHQAHCCAENCFEMKGLLTLRWDREAIPESEEIHFSSQFRIETSDRMFPTDHPWNPWERLGLAPETRKPKSCAT
ncbi:hypothetical protein BGZ63DRAFT_377438 [Mariannaea sp. PMI_226]|nr:hypothetical protein BGZ63DRAFT_377438 [Mariannaea sp. PMI_226]